MRCDSCGEAIAKTRGIPVIPVDASELVFCRTCAQDWQRMDQLCEERRLANREKVERILEKHWEGFVP